MELFENDGSRALIGVSVNSSVRALLGAHDNEVDWQDRRGSDL